VTTAGLRPLPASQVYEAWLINPRRTRPAGLLPAPRGARTWPLLATGLMPGDELGLTVEPAGGPPNRSWSYRSGPDSSAVLAST
jgi:anti-sigma-K factor RskA